MAIYAKSVRALMKDEMASALAPSRDAVFSKQQALDWFKKHYPKIKAGTVAAHLIRLSTNAPSRLHLSAKPGDDDVLYQLDGSHFRLYRNGEDPIPISATSATTTARNGSDISDVDGVIDQDEPAEESGAFAYEKDLRNYLAKNLAMIEPNLHLYQEEGITGIEFPAGGRFIDILGVDAKGGLVVIELKVSRGYDRVIGQLMRYMAWIRQNLADDGQGVRGIIVAREITDDLLLACSLAANVELYEYQLSFTLKRVAR